MMNIAWLSPMPPQKTGIAHYSTMISAGLSSRFNIKFFSSQPTNHLITRAPVRTYDEFRQQYVLGLFDLVIYHLGNNATFHKDIYKLLQEIPGLVVIHDYSIHHLILHLTLEDMGVTAYLDEIEFQYGPLARKLALEGLNGQQMPLWEQGLRYPANRRVINSALGIVVHSQFAAAQLVSDGFMGSIDVIPHFAPNISVRTQEAIIAARNLLKIQRGTLVISVFGFLSRAKRIESILKAISRLRSQFEDLQVYFVGEPVDGADYASLIREHNLGDTVTITGYVSDQTLETFLMATDVCLNLRYPTQGESSGILPRAFSIGLPVIVSDIGAFSELPDSIVRKISVGNNEVDDLVETLEDCFTNGPECLSISEAQIDYAKNFLDINSVVDKYASMIHRMRTVRKNETLLQELGQVIPRNLASESLLHDMLSRIVKVSRGD